ncbi:DinB family protein [Actinomadura sp. ATCC 31491]|uniref:DinB family protein n=1 Tax=Actinomadura luzonensis TaxID=2805427 RepID=A0ABT0G751_9ACTN|nr:DinB family protein [Actinomadura luzonensis]MCK2220436.1 DinB family protein [Actinomadura luzonensis]
MTATTELDALVACLDAQRRHVLGILEGLGEEALRRPVLPSGWACLGLVRHLSLDVERFWFRAVVAGGPDVIDDGDDAWRVDPQVPAEAVLRDYRREIEAANAVIGTAVSLDAPPAWWPPGRFGDWRLRSLREVILHVIAETACHAGHLDATRELIDGSTWFVQDR